MAHPPLHIRRSAKAKRLRLSVKPGVIELVLPQGATESHALAFLDKHRAWAMAKLAELDSAVLPTPGFAQSASVPWRGFDVPLRIQEAAGARIRVTVADSGVHIVLPQGLGENRDAVALRAFQAWTRRWLRAEVMRLAERHTPRLGLRPRDIRVKPMKTRWGSCGPRNDININWLLALAPEAVLEYVVVHELCHIQERNHSPAFWALVARYLPAYAAQRLWLKQHGPNLLRRFGL